MRKTVISSFHLTGKFFSGPGLQISYERRIPPIKYLPSKSKKSKKKKWVENKKKRIKEIEKNRAHVRRYEQNVSLPQSEGRRTIKRKGGYKVPEIRQNEWNP